LVKGFRNIGLRCANDYCAVLERTPRPPRLAPVGQAETRLKVATIELDLGAAFMQGRATVGGDVRALDALVPLLESAEHKGA
jgi:hypothetical protein